MPYAKSEAWHKTWQTKHHLRLSTPWGRLKLKEVLLHRFIHLQNCCHIPCTTNESLADLDLDFFHPVWDLNWGANSGNTRGSFFICNPLSLVRTHDCMRLWRLHIVSVVSSGLNESVILMAAYLREHIRVPHRNDSSNWGHWRWWQHSGHGTSCAPPSQADVRELWVWAYWYGWIAPRCPVQRCNLRPWAKYPTRTCHQGLTKVDRTWRPHEAPTGSHFYESLFDDRSGTALCPPKFDV